LKALFTMDQSQSDTASAKATRLSWKKLGPVAVILVAFGLFFAFDLDKYLTFESLRDHRETLLAWYQANQLMAITSFVVIYSLVVALSIPGATWMTLAGGFMFGTVLATVVVVFSATLGALGIFLVARYALADYCREKAGSAGARMEEGFRENAQCYMLFLRLVPLFPFWLVNLMPAFLNVPTRTYIIGTFFGIIPGSAVFCSVGNGLGAVFEAGGTPDLSIIFEPQILGPILALAVLSLVPIIYNKLKAAKS
jgi:uncharacterized membrane protein YdjX (TVP38/TMEM64 family)